MVALGAERTIEQDPTFAIRVMVDIAVRALSPAVNDPTTAVQVLDYLEESLRVIGSADAPVAAALAEIRGHAAYFKSLGSYPRENLTPAGRAPHPRPMPAPSTSATPAP
jgi:hypothetical protein